jgi:hypothetical protein
MKSYQTVWVAEDIEALLQSRPREGVHIDYKRQLPGEKQAPSDLLADVSAFANAQGGVILFGIEEKEGEPVACCGIGEVADLDKETRRLSATIADNLDPALRGFQFDAVTMPSGSRVLVLRIPPSSSAPHQITKGTPKFYLRGNGLNIPMTSHDLRAAFLSAYSLEEQCRNFVERRCEQISQKRLPIRLNSTGHAVLHVIPIASLVRPASRSVTELQRAVTGALWPPESNGGCSPGVCLEGITSTSFDGQGGCYSHVLIFRNGIVEASYPCRGKDSNQKFVYEGSYLRKFHNVLDVYEDTIRRLGCNPPYLISLSLVDCQGTIPFVPVEQRGDYPCIPLFERIQTLPTLEWAEGKVQWDTVLRNFSDLYANLSGCLHSRYFSADGKLLAK